MLAMIALGAAPAASAQHEEAGLHLSPRESGILGDPLAIKATGLEAGEVIEIRASAVGFDGETLESRARFRADSSGQIDVRLAPALEGSYSGVDASGLLWSMEEVADGGTAATTALEVAFSLWRQGAAIATAEHRWWVKHPRVTAKEVRDEGLYATFYDPGLDRPSGPAVLLVGGSGGGLDWQRKMGQILASHGYPALALAYFRVESLPSMLAEIPLEYLDQGARWLASQPSVDAERITLIGYSKGAELALLFAASRPSVAGVISISGSSTVFQAPRAREALSSWTEGGNPLPFLPFVRVEGWDLLREIYEACLAQAGDDERAAARIPVERIQGPVLLLSGRSDRSWPAAEMLDEVARSLEDAQHAHSVAHYSFEQAGHEIHLPGWTPVRSGGGPGETQRGTAKARESAWSAILGFLADQVPPEG